MQFELTIFGPHCPFSRMNGDTRRFSTTCRWAQPLILLLLLLHGMVTESPAQTTNCYPIRDGLVGLWNAEGNAIDSFGTNHGVAQNISYDSGFSGSAFAFTVEGAYIKIPKSPSLDVGAGRGFTLSFWVAPDDAGRLAPLIEWNAGGDTSAQTGLHIFLSSVGGSGSLTANLMKQDNSWRLLSTPVGLISSKVFSHVLLTYDNQEGSPRRGLAQFYVNGILAASADVGTDATRTDTDLYFGYRPGAIAKFFGKLDSFAIFNRALTEPEALSIFRAGASGICGRIWFDVKPTNQFLVCGSDAQFQANAICDYGLVTYQWQFNGVDLPGATLPVLNLPSLTPADAGIYTVKAVSPDNYTISASAKLNFSFLEAKRYTGLAIQGKVNETYRIEFTEDMHPPVTWTLLTNITLLSSPYFYLDQTSSDGKSRFYRAISSACP